MTKNDSKLSPSTGKQLTRGVIKTLSGMVVTRPSDFIRLAAHSGDLLIKKDFSQALHDTYSYFINKGDIDAKYFDSTNFGDLSPEFNKLSDEKNGIYKLNQLRKIFINLAKDNNENSHKKYLLDIAIELNEPEIKTLLGDYNIKNEMISANANLGITTASEWARAVARISGLKHESLVINASNKLIGKGLITDYQYSDKSGVAFNKGQGRLTSLGLELCEIMILEDDPVINIE